MGHHRGGRMSYLVVAPLVLVRDQQGATHHRYAGTIVEWIAPDQEKHLLDNGFVVKVDADVAVEGVVPFEPADGVVEDSEDDAFTADGKPKRVAPKDIWVKYASSPDRGDKQISEADADAMTKQDLVDLFG
jgi:hypothetical protein